MPADLHIHSNFSDGVDSPEEIVRLAAAAGLTAISLTDHDGIDGIERAEEEGRRAKVEVIPGIEFTTENPRAEIHILGYFIDYKDPELLSVLEKIQADRVKRIYKIVKKLKALKVDIEPEDVFSISGKKSPGRPHVARALIGRGAVSSFKEAFNRYLDFRAPAYVPHYKLSPEEAVRLIVKVGGSRSLPTRRSLTAMRSSRTWWRKDCGGLRSIIRDISRKGSNATWAWPASTVCW